MARQAVNQDDGADETEHGDADAQPAMAAARSAAKASGVSRSPRRRPLRPEGPQRDALGRVTAIGRDGQILTRTSTGTGDQFHIAPDLIPEGWSYQWIALSVMGKGHSITGFLQNGWTPVPAARYDGMFMPKGCEGPIEREGLMLHERPLVLTEDARGEEIRTAQNLIKTQNDQFKPRLPNARAGQRGTGLQARRSIEGLPPDVGRPDYEIDVEEGLV